MAGNENKNLTTDSDVLLLWRRCLQVVDATYDIPAHFINQWRGFLPVSFESGTLTLSVKEETDLSSPALMLTPYFVRSLSAVSGLPIENLHIDVSSASLVNTNSHVSRDVEISENSQFKSLYFDLVRPDRIVSIPRYFMRWLPILGPTCCSLVTAARQLSFLSKNNMDQPSVSFRISWDNLARWAGMSTITCRRTISSSPVLQVFLRIADPSSSVPSRVYDDKTNLSRQLPNKFVLRQEIPLTPADESSLIRFMIEAGIDTDPHAALLSARSTPVKQIIPEQLDYAEPDWSEWARSRHTVSDAVMGLIKTALSEEDIALLSEVSEYVCPQRSCIQIPWYRFTNWFDKLGQTLGWLTIYCDSQTYYSPSRNQVRDVFVIKDFDYLSNILKLTDKRYLQRIMFGNSKDYKNYTTYISKFLTVVDYKYAGRKIVNLSIRVSTSEPLTAEHLSSISTSLSGENDQLGTPLSGENDQLVNLTSGENDQLVNLTSGENDQLLNNFKYLNQNQQYNTTTTETAVVDSGSLFSLLNRCLSNPAYSKSLLRDGVVTKHDIISWMLYITSSNPNHPLGPGYLARQLEQRPVIPPGPQFQELAHLSDDVLENLISQHITRGAVDLYGLNGEPVPPGAALWNDVMADAGRGRLTTLKRWFFG